MSDLITVRELVQKYECYDGFYIVRLNVDNMATTTYVIPVDDSPVITKHFNLLLSKKKYFGAAQCMVHTKEESVEIYSGTRPDMYAKVQHAVYAFYPAAMIQERASHDQKAGRICKNWQDCNHSYCKLRQFKDVDPEEYVFGIELYGEFILNLESKN